MTPNTSPAQSSHDVGLFDTQPAETQIENETNHNALSRTMSLFEIDEALSLLMDSAVEAAEENNGEVPEELRRAVLDYCDAFGQKVDNIAHYIRSQEFAVANATAEINRLTARRSAGENRIERLKGLLKIFMGSRNIRAMKGRTNTISLRKNSQDSLFIVDPTKLGAEYWRVFVPVTVAELDELLQHLPQNHSIRARFSQPEILKREPDNTRIRNALTSGLAVPGAELRRGEHIRLT
jgi:hypothetical protein